MQNKRSYKTLDINGDHYLIEALDEKSLSTIMTSKYKVYKNMTILNDVVFVSDIYFVDKDIDDADIIWPSTDSDFPLMSTSPTSYNKDFISSTILENMSSNSLLIDEEGYEKNIKTITIRIWHPTTSISRDMIVYVDSWINSVHFHWIAKKMTDGISGSSKEIRIGQDLYSEYVDITIPDFKDVMYGGTYCTTSYPIFANDISKKYTKWFKPINTFTIHKDSDIQIGNILSEPEEGCCQLVDLGLMTQPWKYSSDDSSIEYISDDRPSISPLSLKVTLYPWESESEDGSYLIDQNAIPTSYTFTEDLKISIKPSFNFINGHICVLGILQYPDSFDNASNAWQKIWKTDFDKYKELSSIASKDQDMMELLGQPDMVKYTCIISSDKDCKNIIHTEIAYSDKVDDFSFSLRDLFSSWSQVPQMVFIKLIIEDRAIGKGCMSPVKMITKDWIKYTILDTQSSRIKFNDKYKNVQMTMTNIENPEITFIDHINCRIVKTNDESQIKNNKQSSPRMIYKPLFFRVQDLQSISLRSNMTQNIAINLNDYMTKVDEFVLKINDLSFNEIARTGSFVLFKVRSGEIESTDGKYDIMTSDGDYISTGKYIIS